MALEKSDVVDAIGLESDTGAIVLSIIDSWDWSDPESHLNALRNKLNCYFQFIESGQIFEAYPDSKSRHLIIDVVERFEVPDYAIDFFENVTTLALKLNVTMRRRVV